MGPIMLGVFLFVVVGSALFQIFNIANRSSSDILIWIDLHIIIYIHPSFFIFFFIHFAWKTERNCSYGHSAKRYTHM